MRRLGGGRADGSAGLGSGAGLMCIDLGVFVVHTCLVEAGSSIFLCCFQVDYAAKDAHVAVSIFVELHRTHCARRRNGLIAPAASDSSAISSANSSANEPADSSAPSVGEWAAPLVQSIVDLSRRPTHRRDRAEIAPPAAPGVNGSSDGRAPSCDVAPVGRVYVSRALEELGVRGARFMRDEGERGADDDVGEGVNGACEVPQQQRGARESDESPMAVKSLALFAKGSPMVAVIPSWCASSDDDMMII